MCELLIEPPLFQAVLAIKNTSVNMVYVVVGLIVFMV